MELDRRQFVGAILLAASGCGRAEARELIVYRDPGCGCCEGWARQLESTFARPLRLIEVADRTAMRSEAGMPAEFASCHTALIDGMVFEGHVPFADLRRVLTERPAGVRGLAVPGMPQGSPGMENAEGRIEPFAVFAFGAVKPFVFAQHG